ENLQVGRIYVVAATENAAAHRVEKHIIEMPRVGQRLAGFLESIRGGDDAPQFLCAVVNVLLDQSRKPGGPAEQAVELRHLGRPAVYVRNYKPASRLPALQRQLAFEKIRAAFRPDVGFLQHRQFLPERIELDRREQLEAFAQAEGPYRCGSERLGRLRAINGNGAEAEQAEAGLGDQ